MENSSKTSKYTKIGAAWDGDYGISGIFEPDGENGRKIRFYFFKAKDKKSDKSPDYYIMIKNDAKQESAPTKQADDDLPYST